MERSATSRRGARGARGARLLAALAASLAVNALIGAGLLVLNRPMVPAPPAPPVPPAPPARAVAWLPPPAMPRPDEAPPPEQPGPDEPADDTRPPDDPIVVDLDAPTPKPAPRPVGPAPEAIDVTLPSFEAPLSLTVRPLPIEAPMTGGPPAAAPADEGSDGSAPTLERLPRALSSPEPRYPRSALRRGVEGAVEVKLLIDETGRVEDVLLVEVRGGPAFGRAVEEAVRRWRFEPARRAGRAARVWGVKRFTFTLEPEA